jgi:hypothetical protein
VNAYNPHAKTTDEKLKDAAAELRLAAQDARLARETVRKAEARLKKAQEAYDACDRAVRDEALLADKPECPF